MKALNKKAKIIIIVIASVILLAAIVTAGFFGGVQIAYDNAVKHFTVYEFSPEAASSGDRIHFLNTGSSDAILLESDGRFALIDAAEDNDNPRGFPDLEAKGWEQEVLSYLKTRCMRNGKVTLEFILGTHAHSDHIGGFDTVVSDPDVIVNRAYLKKYNPSVIRDYEKKNWDNQEVYDQTVDALNARGVEIVNEIPGEAFSFGNLTIQFVNVEPETKLTNVGENDNTVGTIVSKGSVKAYLAGDMDNLNGDEKRLAPVIGKVDLLKLGHHGYHGSTTWSLLNELQPIVSVATNRSVNSINASVRIRLQISKSVMIATGDYDGIIAEFEDNGFRYYGSIYDGVQRI